MCFHPQLRGETPLLGPLERANRSHWIQYVHVSHLRLSVRNYMKVCVDGRNFQRRCGDRFLLRLILYLLLRKNKAYILHLIY
jgi:hypothetical protein